jgi:hypothetical protein
MVLDGTPGRDRGADIAKVIALKSIWSSACAEFSG